MNAQIDQRWWHRTDRLLLTALFFSFFGPIVGNVVYFLSAGIFGSILALLRLDILLAAKALLGMIILAVIGIPTAFMYGLIPAAVAGISIGLFYLFMNRVPWLVVLGVGLCVALPFSYYYENYTLMGGGPRGSAPFRYSWDTFTVVVATLICSAMIKKVHEPHRAVATPGNVETT